VSDSRARPAGQRAAGRKGITQAVESRLGQAPEAAERARSGVQRMDRELGTIKTEAARNGQRIEGIDQSLRAARDEAAGLKSTVDGLKSEVASQLKTVARPQDVSSALAPISSKLAAVEQNLAGVVKSEDDRKANAERIVLSLEVVEHVADVQHFLACISALVAPGGLLVIGTLDRTPVSYLKAIVGAEMVLGWLPRGTHDWKKFLKPSEVVRGLTVGGIETREIVGVVYSPLSRAWSLNRTDLDVNYMLFGVAQNATK